MGTVLMATMNKIDKVLVPDYELEYILDKEYPKLTIKAETSKDFTLRAIFSAHQDDKVQLVINCGHKHITFADLTGNGPSELIMHRHNTGYGSLLVNLAIQILHRTEFDETLRIYGTITDDRDVVWQFWRRFGLASQGPKFGEKGWLSGSLEELVPIEREYKAGGLFPLSLELAKFRNLSLPSRRQ
jgi:hypothetical protein